MGFEPLKFCRKLIINRTLIIVIASILPFAFGVFGDFVFDDSEAVVRNKDVTQNPWVDAFYHDFWGTNITSKSSHKSYRPLTVLSFKLQYYFDGKLIPYNFKLLNLLLHSICCITLGKVLDKIIKHMGIKQHKKIEKDVALLATLLFAVHPIHVESVSGVVGRADVLAAIMFFKAFNNYTEAMFTRKKSYLYLAIAIICAAVSMLFKENGVTVLGFCICYDMIATIQKKTEKANITQQPQMSVKNAKPNEDAIFQNLDFAIRIICTAAAILMLLYIRWLVMGGTTPVFQSVDNPAAFAPTFFSKVATFNYYYFLNLLLLIWPQWLCYDWSMSCVPLIYDYTDYRLLFVALMYLFAILIGYALMNRKNKGSIKRLMMLSLLLAVIPYLPASNILYPVGFVIAERILYIPSAGFCLFVAIGYYRLHKREKYKNIKLSFTLYCALLILFGVRSFQRAAQWRNEFNLFTSALSVCPNNAKVHYNVAKASDSRFLVDWALSEYEEALRLYPKYYQAMNNYGNLLRHLDRYEEAEFYLRSALALKTDFAAAWMNLGVVLANTKNYDEAEKAYYEALKYRPYYSECYFNLGNLYNTLENYDQAFDSWLRSVSLNPVNVAAWTNLLHHLDHTGQLQKAEGFVKICLQYVTNSPAVSFAIANIYGKLSQYEVAESYYISVLNMMGNRARPVHYGNLGVLYQRWEKYEDAAKMYKLALSLDPKYSSARNNLETMEKIKNKKNN